MGLIRKCEIFYTNRNITTLQISYWTSADFCNLVKKKVALCLLVRSEHEALGCWGMFPTLWCNAIAWIPLCWMGTCTLLILSIHLTSPLLPVQTGSYANDNELAGSDPFWPNWTTKLSVISLSSQHSSLPHATQLTLSTCILFLRMED